MTLTLKALITVYVATAVSHKIAPVEHIYV